MLTALQEGGEQGDLSWGRLEEHFRKEDFESLGGKQSESPHFMEKEIAFSNYHLLNSTFFVEINPMGLFF